MVLVTGGTGLVGSHLLLELCKKGHRIRATYRTPEKIELVKKIFSYYLEDSAPLLEHIEWVKADVLDIPSLTSAIKGVTHVYHTAALVSFDPKEDKRILATNVQGTSNLLNLCLAKGVEKFCFVSSIAALGPSKDGQPISEDTEWADSAATAYAISKHYAEMEVWRGAQEGLSVNIVNPGIIVAPGHWEASSGYFFEHAAKGSNYHLPGGTGFVDVHDVAKAMVQLTESTVINNEQFILVDQHWTYKKFAHLLARGINGKAPQKEVKLWMLELFWRWDWLASKVSGKPRRLSKASARFFKTDVRYHNSKIRDFLGFTFSNLEERTLEYGAIFLQERRHHL